VKKVPTIEAGIILLIEPISGALLATIFLGQQITLNIVIGGFLILLANYLVLTKSKYEAEYRKAFH
jgi:drug/metabolite transporter (DMT)-like permease